MKIRCNPEIRGNTCPIKGDAVPVLENKNQMKIVIILITVFLLPALLFAKREHPEKWYQQNWCEVHNGRVEVALPDGTRCDCVTDTHAIEFDFGST